MRLLSEADQRRSSLCLLSQRSSEEQSLEIGVRAPELLCRSGCRVHSQSHKGVCQTPLIERECSMRIVKKFYCTGCKLIEMSASPENPSKCPKCGEIRVLMDVWILKGDWLEDEKRLRSQYNLPKFAGEKPFGSPGSGREIR